MSPGVLAAWQAGGAEAALAEADALAAEETAASVGMARHGLTLVPDGARILTHCNTGALAVGGTGSAFAVALAAHQAGRLVHLWVDETRPLLQGSRLTAYEARRNGLPHSVLPDSAAAVLMASGQVDLILTGADRISADGSVANKVGTYSLAVLAAHHGVPFVVVAPRTTVDLATPDGAGIPVEQRAAVEVTHHAGAAVAPAGHDGLQSRLRRHPARAGDRAGDRGRGGPSCQPGGPAARHGDVTDTSDQRKTKLSMQRWAYEGSRTGGR